MTDVKHPPYCMKAAEIAEIYEKVERMEKEVIGNGEGLVKTVPKLAQTVESLSSIVGDLKIAMRGFVRFQQTAEGIAQGKELIRKRNRWLIGTAIAISALIGGTLIPLVIKLIQMMTEISSQLPQ